MRVNPTSRPEVAGFTLIELLVVLTILSLLIVLTPRLLQGLPGMRFRREVSDLASAMREARTRAVSSGDTVLMRFDTRRLSWDEHAYPVHQMSPAVTALTFSVPGSNLAPDGLGILAFLPDGSATPGLLRLTGVNRHAVLSVNWVTGSVHVEE